MDLFTHAALGAAGAAAISAPRALRYAALTGALAGLLPDADQLIASDIDPLLTLEYHRHFSHSLAIAPVAALLPAALMRLLLRARLAFVQLYAYSLVAYLLSPLLDACTSYGTHLFWPFSARPVAWNIISIIDPVFSLLVAAALAIAVVRSSPACARAALAIAAAILGIGVVQHERAYTHAMALAQSRSHVPERLLVKPTLGNLLVWRSLYVTDDRIHADAIRIGLPGNVRIYTGESAQRFDIDRDLGLPKHSLQYLDVRRFLAFADDLAVRHPSRPEMIGDARFSMLPTRIEPLWGIVLDPAAPSTRVRFEVDRRLTAEVRARFIAMLLGRDLDRSG